jgi:hypothetical protein
MNDTVVVVAILGGTFVLALAVDRGVPNALESAAYMLEDVAAASVSYLRNAADKLRQRHGQIEAANRRREKHSASPVRVPTNGACNAA